jgi:hypothetical protein
MTKDATPLCFARRFHHSAGGAPFKQTLSRIATACLTVLVLLCAREATASTISSSASGAKGSDGYTTTTVPLAATGQMNVFTQSPPQTNGTIIYNVNGAPAGPTLFHPVTVGVIFKYTYNPAAWTGNFNKPVGTIADLQSISNGFNAAFGATSSFAEANTTVPKAAKGAEAILSVNSTVDGSKDAFANATDPLDFGAGSVTIEFNLAVDDLYADGPDAYAGLGYTLDSSTLGDIFDLEIHLDSDGAPVVAYEANPLASLSMSPDQIKDYLAMNLVDNDGQWSLSTPLQLDVTFNSATSFSVGFGDYSYAHADLVPEPASLSLVAIGGVFIAVGRLRKRKRAAQGNDLSS